MKCPYCSASDMPKLILETSLSLLGIILLAPLFVIISILIKLDSKGPVLFLQERIGLNGRKFKIFKFRTMQVVQASDSLKITVGRDSRITKIGNILRKYKLDELPQLFNVLLCDMSLVGPRPEVAEYVNYYSQYNKDTVLSIRPGITDLASIMFRNETELLSKEQNPQSAYIKKILPRKLRYCRFYVKKQSLCLDIKIIYMTFVAVIRG